MVEHHDDYLSLFTPGSEQPDIMASPASDSAPVQQKNAPDGIICDPVTGVCRLPTAAGAGDGDSAGLFPLPKTLRPLEKLEDEKGNEVNPSVFQGKMVGVYVSAGWCPPCRAFSPKLAAWAKERTDDFVVVLVSLDKSEPEMREFAAGKGFLRLPFDPESARHHAAQSFDVNMLPALVIVNGDSGKVVTTWGRSAINKNPKGCLEKWKAGRDGVTWFQLAKPW